MNDFVVRAAALSLRTFPAFNASWADDHVEQFSRVNVGIAVATDDALLVPVVFDADRKGLAEIAVATRDLVARTRSRSLGLDELSGATFTVSNLGMFGVHSFTAIVDAPQAAILAVGGIARRPAEGADGSVVFRDTMIATLTSDHRVVYGADAAAFMAHLRSTARDAAVPPPLTRKEPRCPSSISVAPSARHSTRRWPPTIASSSSARTSRSPAACSP